jgi:hypothetical protein
VGITGPRLAAVDQVVKPKAADLRSLTVFAECLILAQRPLRGRDHSVTRWDAGPLRRSSRHFQQPVLDYRDGRVRLREDLAALHPEGDVGGETDLNTQRR